MGGAKREPAGILASCVVPWDDRYGFVEDLFREQVRLLAGLTPRLYVFGTAGEGYAVSDSQFAAIAAAFADEARRAGAEPMVGVISLSLATVRERIALARELGVRAFQLSLPAWGALRDAEVDAFFRETCDRFADCRFLHYNLARSGRVLAGADYARLAADHPNLVAVKFSSSDPAAVEELAAAAGPLQLFLTEPAYALARDRHECGLLASVTLASFARAREYAAARGPALRRLAAEARAVDELLARCAGPDVHMDGAFDKLVAKLHLPAFPLRLLPPYAGAGDEAFAAFQAALPAGWRPREAAVSAAP